MTDRLRRSSTSVLTPTLQNVTSVESANQAFRDARDVYRSARNEQRRLIVDALTRAGFTVKTRGHARRGLTTYSSGGRLAPPFDLSNWMWVEGERGEHRVVVRLQVLDQDPNSKNIHALIDRLGISVSRSGVSVDDGSPLFEDATTSLELPLNDEDLAEIVSIIEERIAAAS